MNFASTRTPDHSVALGAAINAGLAPDGGLYVPERLPQLGPDDFEGLTRPAAIAVKLLEPFFAGEPLAGALPEICDEALSFPLPLVATADPRLSVLELFHGPTAAFKDVGARFLAACLDRLDAEPPPTVMVATSGDTGSAVAAACAERRRLKVVVLYPRDGVSPRQEHQLTCWPERVLSLRVNGDFDQCQRLVKEAFLDRALAATMPMTSANSISVGRLLPQMVYYAAASLECWRATGQRANFVVPTGNLGNALAGIWSRRLGLPIGRIALATNANATIPRYLDTGRWAPGETIPTLASAMDVSNPSNMERLRHLFPGIEELAGQISAHAIDDVRIRDAIRRAHRRLDRAVCPHTATAYEVYRTLRETGDERWIMLATAHAAKFEGIVEPLIGTTVAPPPALTKLLERPTRRHDMEPDLDSLKRQLEAWRRFSRH